MFGGRIRNDIDRDTQTSQWKQSHFIEEKHIQKHYRPISSNCSPWEDYWVAMKVSSNPLPLSHPIDKRKFDFSDPFLCHFASAEVPCKKVKLKVGEVSGKFVHICTHLVSSCLKDIKSFSFDGHWPGLQKVTRILSWCPEWGLKARLWEPKILLWEEMVGLESTTNFNWTHFQIFFVNSTGPNLTALQQGDINCSSLPAWLGGKGKFERKIEGE